MELKIFKMNKKTILTAFLLLFPLGCCSQVSAAMPREVLDRELCKLEMKRQTIELLERELQEKSLAFEKKKESHLMKMRQRELFLEEKEKRFKEKAKRLGKSWVELKKSRKTLSGLWEEFERGRKDFLKPTSAEAEEAPRISAATVSSKSTIEKEEPEHGAASTMAPHASIVLAEYSAALEDAAESSAQLAEMAREGLGITSAVSSALDVLGSGAEWLWHESGEVVDSIQRVGGLLSSRVSGD